MKKVRKKYEDLCNFFRINKLKPFQKAVIDDLNHGHDVIALTRTGEGKTISFLSQAYYHPAGTMLVITPTISLMRDLVHQCQRYGFKAAALFSGNLDNTAILHDLKHGEIQVLFLAPERLGNQELRTALKCITVHTVVVDEVHCLTEWGNEFRPMYRKIGKFISKLHHRPVIAAFSATVPPEDIPLITESLGMDDYRVHIGKLKRTNLSIKKRFVKTDAERYREVGKAVYKAPDKGRIVIYCTRICDVEDMQDYLVEGCHIPSAEISICHSKCSNRPAEEERFRTGDARIMVATSAFGMGVNIPDIRLVVVSQLPFSIASCYQMAGRSGRDGNKAKVLLLYNDRDFQMNLDIISGKDERAVKAADEMYELCQSDTDLHEQILDYLGKGAD